MKKLYDVTLSFEEKDFDGDVKNVGLIGEFLFYQSQLQGNTEATGMKSGKEKYVPSEYKPSYSPIGGLYYKEMQYHPEKKAYTVDLKLPAGVYPYNFVINATVGEPVTDERWAWSNFLMDDHKLHNFSDRGVRIPDPKNAPVSATPTGIQRNSELFVGTWEEEPWLLAPASVAKGTVSYMTYEDIDGHVQSLGIYLPPAYEKSSQYPVVFVSHGGGGNEADWFSQGNIHHIMDTLIFQGKTKPAVLVTMNNSVYEWDFEKISRNLKQCIFPFVRKVFSVSSETGKNAFCGLSMGSMTTLYLYMHHTQLFHYYGAFSGGIAGGEHFSLESPLLKYVKLMIGCGEEDIAYNESEIGVPPTIRALKEKKLPYIPYFVPGSHDWFCWPQMFAYFAENVLWKG